MTFWIDLGTALGGYATVVLVVVGIFAGLPGVSAWVGKQRELRDLAAEQRRQIRLDELRQIEGWMPGTVSTFEVVEVVDSDEVAKALDGLTKDDRISPYILLRHDSDMRASDFQRMLTRERFIGRVPTKAESAALVAGREVLAKQVPEQA